MAKQVEIKAWARTEDNPLRSEKCGTVTLTETDESVFFYTSWRRREKRKLWIADDGTEWVYYADQFNELNSIRHFDAYTRYGR